MKQDNIYENDSYKSISKKSKKIQFDNTKHYPNKDEAALLRKLMAENGLSEDEVRSIKKYRKMLTDAQKSGEKRKRCTQEKFYKDLIKSACKETGLVPQHPKTLEVLQTKIDEAVYNRRNWFGFGFMLRGMLKAETAVNRFAK